jgi:hypothetical protein
MLGVGIPGGGLIRDRIKFDKEPDETKRIRGNASRVGPAFSGLLFKHRLRDCLDRRKQPSDWGNKRLFVQPGWIGSTDRRPLREWRLGERWRGKRRNGEFWRSPRDRRCTQRWRRGDRR